MGATGVSKSEVSRLVVELDADLAAFRERRLEGTRYPYLWLDAHYEKVRDGGRIVNAAFLIAIAANERGEREVLGCAVASAESEASWSAFLRSLVARGLAGVRLVTSDAQLGIRAAVGSTLGGAAWQRCRVHLLRDILTHVPRHAAAWSPRSCGRSSPSPINRLFECCAIAVSTNLGVLGCVGIADDLEQHLYSCGADIAQR